MAQISAAKIKQLITLARRASKSAYAPYSDFPVGAAVLTADGETFTGCNVENASYGLSICAERNAIFQAVCEGKKNQIQAVVVFTPTTQPTAPCGACRQVINEFSPAALIICVCNGKVVLQRKLQELLPEAFGPENLA